MSVSRALLHPEITVSTPFGGGTQAAGTIQTAI
jgi:hypothetical protein